MCWREVRAEKKRHKTKQPKKEGKWVMKTWGLLMTVLMLAFAGTAMAQHDSSYYETHNDVMHGRLALIQKYNVLHYKNTIEGTKTNYFPHTIPGIGVGFTYDWMTINLSFGLRFNGNEREKGKTKYLDIQLHSYAKKFIIDIFGQIYKGMYVPGDKDENGNFYHRPDLETRLIGGGFQYVLNNKRFSFRSAFLQTDWQKRSAGSLLFGFESYAGRVTSDSSLLPYRTDVDPSGQLPKKDFFWQVGPTIGYAYTAVIKRHFFVTASFAESFNYGRRVMTEGSEEVVTSKFILNPSYRLITGYNTYRWGIALFYVNNRVNLPGAVKGHEIAVSSGTFRINFVYRFRSKGKLGELIDRIGSR
jgi:hypothetical protein